MIVTNDNYFSREVEQAYFTNSQIKAFLKCPAQWQAKRTGIIEEPPQDYKSPLFQGSYVDMALTEPENFEEWCEDNKDIIFGKGGKKYAAFLTLDDAVKRVKKDKFFMSHLQGQKQTIITLEDFHGHPFKCKLDDLNFDECALTDLKTTGEEMDGDKWMQCSEGTFAKVHWIAFWKYPMQLGLYREAVFAKWSFRPHPYIAAMTKKDPVNFEVFDLMSNPGDDMIIQSEAQRGIEAMDEMAKYVGYSPEELDHCGKCAYCISTKILDDYKTFEYDPKMLQF